MNWIINETDYLDNMPFNLKEIKDQETTQKFIHPDEFQVILEATMKYERPYWTYSNEFFCSLWKLYKSTGMRLSEIYTLEITGDFLHITGKRDRTRIVPIQEEIQHLWDDILPNLDIDHLTISKHFSKICRSLGYKYTLHHLRHTFACEMLAKHDGNIWKVSELLGHSNLTTTQRYLKSFPLAYLKQIFT